VAVMFTKLQMKSDKRKQLQKSPKTQDSDGESNGKGLEDETHHGTNWRDTQDCYRCHTSGHIAWFCPGVAPAVIATTTTTSFENYWMTVTNGDTPAGT